MDLPQNGRKGCYFCFGSFGTDRSADFCGVALVWTEESMSGKETERIRKRFGTEERKMLTECTEKWGMTA